MPNGTAAVFLDRDGVIIENIPDYVRSVAQVRFLTGSLDAVAQLTRHGRPVVVVTNQAAIGRGLLTVETLAAIHSYMRQHIEATGGQLAGIYVCPHRPDEGCACRKPAPGMLVRAAQDLGLDLSASVLIGDNVTDLLAAQAAGVRPILVRTGLGSLQALPPALAALTSVYSNLAAAVHSLFDGSGAPRG